MEGSGTEFSVMNIDEFLNENNFDFDHFPSKISEDDKDHGMAAPSNGGNSYRYELFNQLKCKYFGIHKIIRFIQRFVKLNYYHFNRNPNSVSSEDGMTDTEQPISPPVPVVLTQSPNHRNELCLKRKADIDEAASPHPQMPHQMPQWNKSKDDAPKVFFELNMYFSFPCNFSAILESTNNFIFIYFREKMNFCTLRAKELGLKEKGKSVDVEKRSEWSFRLKNWLLQPFPVQILTQQEDNLV